LLPLEPRDGHGEHDGRIPPLFASGPQHRQAVHHLHALGHLELWRLNPLELAWNVIHSARQEFVFLVALRGERY
jgi:hypothetical protein